MVDLNPQVAPKPLLSKGFDRGCHRNSFLNALLVNFKWKKSSMITKTKYLLIRQRTFKKILNA